MMDGIRSIPGFFGSHRGNDRERLGNAEERSLILCRGAGRITSRASSVQWKDGSRSLAKIHTTSFSGCVFLQQPVPHQRRGATKGRIMAMAPIPSFHHVTFSGMRRPIVKVKIVRQVFLVDFVFREFSGEKQ